MSGFFSIPVADYVVVRMRSTLQLRKRRLRAHGVHGALVCVRYVDAVELVRKRWAGCHVELEKLEALAAGNAR